MPLVASSSPKWHGDPPAWSLMTALVDGSNTVLLHWKWGVSQHAPMHLSHALQAAPVGCSSNVERLLGYSEEQLRNTTPSLMSLVNLNDKDALQEWLESENGGRVQLRLKMGELAAVPQRYRWFQVHAVLEQDRTGLLACFQDIDEDKRKAQRLELVMEGTRLGMYDWNPQSNDLSLNDRWASMMGYALEEVTPLSTEMWTGMVHPEDMPKLWEDLQRHLRGETPFYENIHRMLHRHGEWIHVLDRGKVVEHDEAGVPLRFTGTYTDVTPQKKAELQAREALRIKNLFLASMSHEIRTPLHGIISLVDLMRRMELPREAQHYVKIIQRSSDILLVVINDLLDVCKMDAGNLVLEPRVFDLPELLEGFLQLFKEKALSAKLQVTLDLAPELPRRLVSDHVRLGQIVCNLLSNAIKFTPVGGAILLEVRSLPNGPDTTAESCCPPHSSCHRACPDHLDSCTKAACSSRASSLEDVASSSRAVSSPLWLEIKVCDTGIGIPADKLEAVFQPFVQAAEGTTRQYGGTGLGLTICSKLARLLGGTLSVCSQIERGTCFTLRLPFQVACASVSPAVQLVTSKTLPDLSWVKVLVADDNKINRLVIDRMLADLGFSTPFVVEDGQQAIDQVQQLLKADEAGFDLVLMDLHMPRVDGFTATPRILQLHQERGLQIPAIIALTADAFEASRKRCFDVGFTDFVPKPFRRADLIEVLQRLIRRKSLKRKTIPEALH